MNIFLSIIGFFLAIFVLVLVHEFGHFIVARWCGVRVLRFSFGFGPVLWKWRGKKYQTEYVIAPLLLGGYVKFLDSREGEVAHADLKYAYDHQNSFRKILIILAGPGSNFLLAFFAFCLMFAVGVKLPKPIVGKVILNSPAYMVGLKTGSEIVSVDEKSVIAWQDIIIKIMSRFGESGQFTLKAQDNSLSAPNSYTFDLSKWQSNSFRPDPLKDFGIVPYHPIAPPTIGGTEENGPAAKAGIMKNDVVISVDQVRVKNWDDLTDYIKNHPRKTIKLLLRRNHKILKMAVTPSQKFGPDWKKIGYLGIKSINAPWPNEMITMQKYSVVDAIFPALKQIHEFTNFNWIVLQKMVTGKISLHVLGGPISIFQTTGHALQQGFVVYAGILALVSVTIAFINLLPIPGLDGGHVFVILIETILRRKISYAVQLLLLRLGMIFLVLLIFQSTFNDIMRLFS